MARNNGPCAVSSSSASVRKAVFTCASEPAILLWNSWDGKDPLRGARIEARFRGAHVLQRDENGLEKCVACFLCAAACPANCIFIEAAENTAEQRISSSERYAKIYNIDYNRCIFCGYCVEACPTDAITHGHGFELATLNATNLVMRKEDMLLPVTAIATAK